LAHFEVVKFSQRRSEGEQIRSFPYAKFLICYTIYILFTHNKSTFVNANNL